MKKHVCSLENAKKLDALGVDRESYFCYAAMKADVVMGAPAIYEIRESSWHYVDKYRHQYDDYPAYTVGELGEMLPLHICTGRTTKGGFAVYDENMIGCYITNNSEADAKALALIWLIENGHVDVNDINGGG